jgi:hypothetical protein
MVEGMVLGLRLWRCNDNDGDPRLWEKWEQYHAARIFIATQTDHCIRTACADAFGNNNPDLAAMSQVTPEILPQVEQDEQGRTEPTLRAKIKAAQIRPPLYFHFKD